MMHVRAKIGRQSTAKIKLCHCISHSYWSTSCLWQNQLERFHLHWKLRQSGFFASKLFSHCALQTSSTERSSPNEESHFRRKILFFNQHSCGSCLYLMVKTGCLNPTPETDSGWTMEQCSKLKKAELKHRVLLVVSAPGSPSWCCQNPHHMHHCPIRVHALCWGKTLQVRQHITFKGLSSHHSIGRAKATQYESPGNTKRSLLRCPLCHDKSRFATKAPTDSGGHIHTWALFLPWHQVEVSPPLMRSFREGWVRGSAWRGWLCTWFPWLRPYYDFRYILFWYTVHFCFMGVGDGTT